MKKTFRQKLSMVMAAALLITSCPINVFAEDEAVQIITETQSENLSTEETVEFENENLPEAVQNAIDNQSEENETDEVIANENAEEISEEAKKEAEAITDAIKALTEGTPSDAAYKVNDYGQLVKSTEEAYKAQYDGKYEELLDDIDPEKI